MEHRRARPDQAARWPSELIRRLRDRFAPGGLLHYGQGKWYPGEQLPRWALRLYWRAGRRAALARSGAARRTTASQRHRRPSRDAERFALRARRAARHRLRPRRCRPSRIRPTSCWREQPAAGQRRSDATSRLDDPQERARLARVFDRGLDQPVGYVLPLQRWQARDGRGAGRSGRWSLRRERLFLMPGDRPVGSACRWPRCRWLRQPRPTSPHDPSRADPFARARRALPRQRCAACMQPRAAGARRPGRAARPSPVADAGAVRTALASSRATASSRLPAAHSRAPRTISIWSPPSRRPPAELAQPVRARRLPAAARPAAATSSRSPPIPA